MTVHAATLTRVAIAAASLLLVWRVIQVNVISFDETGRPRLPGTDSPESILAENPAQVGALLALAQGFESDGDAARASSAYAAALDLAPMDRRVLALASAHFLRRDDPRGLELLARLATHYPETRPQAFPAMADILASGRHRQAWEGIVAGNPDWLGPFLADACARSVDTAVLVPMLLDRAGKAGATPAETNCLIDRLRKEDRWEEAYHLWLNLLPRGRLANVGYVFNGGFENDPSGTGFDWIPQQGAERQAGHLAEIRQTPNAVGKRALRVAYNGNRQSGLPVRQYLALPAGDYVLSGRVRTEAIKAVRGIHWTVRCLQGGKLLGILASSERFLGSGEWRPFSMEVTVGESCRGQVLQLEPAGSEGAVAFVSGTAWFDEIALRRQ